MIGDGVEAGYLAPYLEGQGVSSRDTALLFTIYGDRIGHRKVVVFGGGIGAAIMAPAFYYVPQMYPGNFMVAAIVGALYGATLAAFVPLSGLVPQICPKEKAPALSALGLAQAHGLARLS